MVYEQKDGGYLAISDIESMIGSESDSAERVRRHRNSVKSLHCNAHCNATVTPKVTTDIEIEIDKDTTVVVSNAREAFCKAYAVTDDDTTTDGIDFDALDKAYSASAKFLQTHPAARRMSWVVKHYAEIIAGKYIDFAPKKVQTDESPDSGRIVHEKYTEEYLNGLFTTIQETDE